MCFTMQSGATSPTSVYRIVSIIMSDVVPLRSRGTWQGNVRYQIL